MKTFKQHLEEAAKIIMKKKRKKTIVYSYPISSFGIGYSLPPSGEVGDSSGSGSGSGDGGGSA